MDKVRKELKRKPSASSADVLTWLARQIDVKTDPALNVETTALVVLALIEGGSSRQWGPHAKTVSAALDRLLRR